MNNEFRQDYVHRLEAALYEYVEEFGASDAVRKLFCVPTHENLKTKQTPDSQTE